MYYLPVVTPEIVIPPLTLIVDGVEMDDDESEMTLNPTPGISVAADVPGHAGSMTEAEGLNYSGALYDDDPVDSEEKDVTGQHVVAPNVTPTASTVSALRTSRYGRPLKQTVRFEVGDVSVDYNAALSAVNA